MLLESTLLTSLVVNEPTAETLEGAVPLLPDSADERLIVARLHVEGAVHGIASGDGWPRRRSLEFFTERFVSRALLWLRHLGGSRCKWLSPLGRGRGAERIAHSEIVVGRGPQRAP